MLIAIVGPTGVGKTKLSIELAKKYNASIINCDAVQIYQELNIGSAKVTEEEKEGIKHYLLDIKKPNEEYTVRDYQKDFRNIVDNNEGNFIIVGGTGLYLTAAIMDYDFADEIKTIDEELDNDTLYKMALEKDNNCNIDKNNRSRLINFLKKDKLEEKASKVLYDVKIIGLTAPREVIYEKINKRVDVMFNLGLVDEVKNLINKYPDSKVLNRAIGYKETIKYLNKEVSLEECKEEIKKNSRHYAKRQYTWFNNKNNVKWFNVDYDNFSNTINDVIKYIEGDISEKH